MTADSPQLTLFPLWRGWGLGTRLIACVLARYINVLVNKSGYILCHTQPGLQLLSVPGQVFVWHFFTRLWYNHVWGGNRVGMCGVFSELQASKDTQPSIKYKICSLTWNWYTCAVQKNIKSNGLFLESYVHSIAQKTFYIYLHNGKNAVWTPSQGKLGPVDIWESVGNYVISYNSISLASFPDPTLSQGETVWWTKSNFLSLCTLLRQCHLAMFKTFYAKSAQKMVQIVE